MRRPTTGEPCAGEPHARFGGRGGHNPSRPLSTRRGDVYRFAATFGQSPDFGAVLRQHSHSPGRGSIIGRVLVEGRAVQMADLAADQDYAVPESIRIGKVRSNLGVPLMREGLPMGVIVLGRRRVEPFTERQI